MPVKIVPFAPEHLSAVQRFSEQAWKRPQSDAFYRWRYLDAPGHRSFLALLDRECVAMLSGFERRYRFGYERVTVLETCDWFCLPRFRPSGLGLRVMLYAMGYPYPLLAVGGTKDTVSLLPRLGWRRLGVATRYSLPMHGRVIAELLKRRYGVPRIFGDITAKWIMRLLHRGARASTPLGAVTVVDAGVSPEIEALYGGQLGYGTIPLYDQEYVRWLVDALCDMGRFVLLCFRISNELRGWALLRVYSNSRGRELVCVEIFAPCPDEAIYAWMVSEIVSIGKILQVDRVTAQTTCPVLAAGLRRNRFLEVEKVPIWIWARDAKVPRFPLLLGFNAADGALLPYPGQ